MSYRQVAGFNGVQRLYLCSTIYKDVCGRQISNKITNALSICRSIIDRSQSAKRENMIITYTLTNKID